MPGIFGQYNKKKNSNHVDGKRMCHEQFHLLQEVTFTKGACGVVTQDLIPNGIYQDEEYVAAFYGEIFEILEYKENEWDYPIQRPEVVLKLLKQYGESIISKLNGTFLLAIYDKKEERLAVYNDRFGIYPLYYRELDNAFMFATEAKALFSGEIPQADKVGLAEMLSFDYCLESRTIFKGIKQMTPANKISVTERGGVEKKVYWTFQSFFGDMGGRRMKRSEYEARLYHLQKAAVSRRKDEINMIGLTGGFDSRLILASLGKDAKVETFNFGKPGSGDVIGASQLSDVYSTSHHYLDFSKGEEFYPYAEDIVYRTDGMCWFDRFYIYDTAKIKSEYGNIELSGTGGDALSGQKNNFTGLFPNMSMRINKRKREHISKKIFCAISRGRLSVGKDPSYNKSFASETWKMVQDDFYEAVRACAGRTFGAFTMQVKARSLEKNCTCVSLSLCEQFIRLRYPVYDYNIVDFFNSMPQKYRYGQNLYISMIKKYYPEAAAVPHSETGKPIHRFNVVSVDLETIGSFLKGMLGFEKKAYHNTFGFVKEIILSDKGALRKIICEQPETEDGIFDISNYGTIDNLIDRAQGGEGYAFILLKNIIQISIINKVFFDEKIQMYSKSITAN